MYHYSLALRRSSFLMVNSSWTKNHVDSILVHSDSFLDLIHLRSSLTRVHSTPKRAEIVYPPCDTHALSHLPLERRPSLLLSLAQFRYGHFFPAHFRLCVHERARPEKDHAAQIRMMARLRISYPEHRQSMRLLLVGGVRNEEDAARVEELKELADSLQVSVCCRLSRSYSSITG